ncbi:hypothetical protein BGZ70_000529 [Mortierella alpina]|uniref:Uncharacterized protein n=1 Tax=Mortierella alpina TaxID=64518 RepID=A0A9P6LYH9_MORAP|nr:hypothetical protein BGZ70_000529 [Mortierella alpina]
MKRSMKMYLAVALGLSLVLSLVPGTCQADVATDLADCLKTLDFTTKTMVDYQACFNDKQKAHETDAANAAQAAAQREAAIKKCQAPILERVKACCAKTGTEYDTNYGHSADDCAREIECTHDVDAYRSCK